MHSELLPAAAGAAVVLRDGGTLWLRPPVRADGAALVAFFAGLSERSLYLRFHGTRRVEASLVEPFLAADWNDTGALVGTLVGEAGERIVALASYARLCDPHAAEVAFAVADGEQHRGIGTLLLEQLAARAGGTGIERFVAEVTADNHAALTVFAAAGFERAREPDPDAPLAAAAVVHLVQRLAQPGSGCAPDRSGGRSRAVGASVRRSQSRVGGSRGAGRLSAAESEGTGIERST